MQTRKVGNATWNTAILGVLVLLIGYSSYATVILRSSANTPINIGAPDDPLKLSSYLQRDQYGDWPIISGRNYNQKYPFVNPTGQETTGTEYLKNKEDRIYEEVGNKIKYTYTIDNSILIFYFINSNQRPSSENPIYIYSLTG